MMSLSTVALMAPAVVTALYLKRWIPDQCDPCLHQLVRGLPAELPVPGRDDGGARCGDLRAEIASAFHDSVIVKWLSPACFEELAKASARRMHFVGPVLRIGFIWRMAKCAGAIDEYDVVRW